MPYRTIWEDKGIVWEFYGDVTAQEIEDANDGFYRDLRSDDAKYQIVDATKVTSVEWNELQINITAAYDIGASHSIKNLKMAYVATDEETIYKLEKYIEVSRRLNSNWHFKGFQNIKDAREWIAS